MSFEAKYPGHCWACDERIAPGEQVRFNDAEEITHAVCGPAASPDDPGRHERRCPDCFTIHAGECL